MATLEGAVSRVSGVTVGMAWAVSRLSEDRKETIRYHGDCRVRTQSPLLCLPMATPFCWLSLSFSTHLQFPLFSHLSYDPKIATSTPKSAWAFSSRTLHQSDNTLCVSQIKFLKERSWLAQNIYGWSLPLGQVTTPVPQSQIVIIGDRWVMWHRGLQAGGRAAMVSYRMFEVEKEFQVLF